MRWEYETPVPRVITVDGETLRLYSPEDAQLQIASLASGAFSPTALDFLLGTGKLREQFAAERLPDGGDGSVHLRLHPRRESRFQFLELRVAPDRHALRSSVLLDLLGNRTEVRFEGLEENRGVPDERFTISIPEGTEVLDLR
jgi:outer membrane lipoprotein carrier protein